MKIELNAGEVYHIIHALSNRRRLLAGDYELLKTRGMTASAEQIAETIRELLDLSQRIEVNFNAEKAAQ